MKKRTKLNKPYKIKVSSDDYDDTLMLSIFIIVFSLVISILMCMD